MPSHLSCSQANLLPRPFHVRWCDAKWHFTPCHLVPIPRRIVLRAHHKTPALLRSPVNRLQNIHQLTLILQHPVQLVIVSRTKITHHVFIPEEEHNRHGIVEFVHGLEVWHFVEIAEINRREVLHSVGDFVQDFVLRHAVGVAVAAEADHDESVFFGENGLVDVPASAQMGEDDGAHGGWLGVREVEFGRGFALSSTWRCSWARI